MGKESKYNICEGRGNCFSDFFSEFFVFGISCIYFRNRDGVFFEECNIFFLEELE